MNEEHDLKSVLFQWENLIKGNFISRQLKVLHIQEKVLLKHNIEQPIICFSELNYGVLYFSCCVQSIRHCSRCTIVTVRSDYDQSELDVDLNDILSYSRVVTASCTKDSIQVGQLVLILLPTANGVFALRRIERIEYATDHNSFITAIYCSLVERDNTKDESAAPSSPLEKVTLTDNNTIILKHNVHTVFELSPVAVVCEALKNHLITTTSLTRILFLSEFYSVEKCQLLTARASHIVHHLSSEATRLRDVYQSYVSGVLNNTSQSGSLNAQVFCVDDFVHVFRVLQDVCKLVSCFVSLAVEGSTLDKQADTAVSLEDNSVRGFQGGDLSNCPLKAVDRAATSRDSLLYTIPNFAGCQLFSSALIEIVQLLVPIASSGLIPLLESALPVPFDVSTESWVVLMFAVCSARDALSSLCETINRFSFTLTGCVSESVINSCRDHIMYTLSLFNSAVDEYCDRSVLALCDSYELSAVDSMHRPEWGSHSAFFRDKKISHGVLALTASVRVVLHELMTFCGSGSRGAKDSYPEMVQYIAMQLLLGAHSMTLRNYLMLRPSRVRLFQWRVDLCHLLYTSVDSLSQLVKYRLCCAEERRGACTPTADDSATGGWRDGCSVTLSQINVDGESHEAEGSPSPVAIDLKEIFPDCNEQSLLGEMCTLILYTIVVIAVVTNSAACDMSELLFSLQSIVDSARSDIQSLPVSHREGCCLFDLFKLIRPHSMEAFVTLLPPFGIQSSYDLTGDITAYSAYFQSTPSGVTSTNSELDSCSLCFSSEEERLVYVKEQQTRPDNPYAGTRAVVFARIVCMLTDPLTRDSPLWRFLRDRQHAVLDVHCQLADEDLSEPATIASMANALLSRRLEVIDCEYPKLTDTQMNNAHLIQQFVEKNAL